ncbi:unknown [Ruminococcus sp. CAG:353]|nr:unknown [Ruminococcus sp. CAG:353]
MNTVLQDINRKTAVYLLRTAEKSVVKNGNIAALQNGSSYLCSYLCTCGVLVVENSSAAVTALEGAVKLTVSVPVEIHADVKNVLYLLSSLGNKHLYGVGVVLEAACNESVVCMKSDIVVVHGLVNSSNAALCQCGIAQLKLTLAYNKHPEAFGQAKSGIKSAYTCTCDNYVIIIGKFHDLHLVFKRKRYSFQYGKSCNTEHSQ